HQARLLVWGAWFAGLTSTLVTVILGSRNLPLQEDWYMVPAMTGHQQHFWSWLWTRNNEHLIPIPKLTYLALLKLWPDFRVGMVFNIAVVAAIAGAFIVFMR